MIRIVRDSGTLFIGEYGQDSEGVRLGNVRAIEFLNQNGRKVAAVMKIVGWPQRMYFPVNVISWDVSDEELIKSYKESVSGLSLPPVSSGKILTPKFAS